MPNLEHISNPNEDNGTVCMVKDRDMPTYLAEQGPKYTVAQL